MLRTLMFGAPGLAAADQFPQSAQDVEVRGDDGTVIGRVASVEPNAQGEIEAVEIPGIEPADAPAASRDLVAENNRERLIRVRATGHCKRNTENGIFKRRALR